MYPFHISSEKCFKTNQKDVDYLIQGKGAVSFSFNSFERTWYDCLMCLIFLYLLEKSFNLKVNDILREKLSKIIKTKYISPFFLKILHT